MNIVRGNFAYDYVNTKEIQLPVVDGAEKTTFTVTVVGIGVGDGDYALLTPAQQDKQLEIAMVFVAKDIVLPVAMGIIMPLVSMGGSGEDLGMAAYTGWPVFADWLMTIYSLDGFPAACASGDVSGAATLALNALSENAGMQTITSELLGEAVYRMSGGVDGVAAYANANRAFSAAQTIMTSVGVANILLTGFDVGRVVHDIARSNAADIWTIDVLPPKVAIDPEEVVVASLVDRGQTRTLTASVETPGGSVGATPKFVYSWTVTQTAGTINGHVGQTQFDTSSPTISYTANALTDGSDVITVQAYELKVKKQVERIPLGSATSNITVEYIEPEPFAGRMFSWYTIEEHPPTEYHQWTHGWRVGVEFDKITTGPIPGKYAVYGYGFNDTAYHGTSVYFIGPPWPCYAGCGEDTGTTYRIGLTGGGGGSGTEPNVDDILATIEWGLSRFEGAIWEITPIY